VAHRVSAISSAPPLEDVTDILAVIAFEGKATVGPDDKLCMKHSNHRAIVQMDRLSSHLRPSNAKLQRVYREVLSLKLPGRAFSLGLEWSSTRIGNGQARGAS
jgi:hypothetical protein